MNKRLKERNLAPDDYAAAVAKSWKEGLASSGEKPERISRLKRIGRDGYLYSRK